MNDHTAEVSEHIVYWIELLPNERRERFYEWLQDHTRVVTANAVGSLNEFLSMLPDEQRMLEAWTILNEVVWQWHRSLKSGT